MARKITTIFEMLIFATLFSLFAALVLTTETNDAIIESTEEFVDTVRYKGCITENMYYEFLNKFRVPVSISFSISHYSTTGNTLPTLNFTNDVFAAFEADADADGKPDRIYKMNPGDEITVTVRKPSGNYYDSIASRIAGNTSLHDNPVIAARGGMILNAQYQ